MYIDLYDTSVVGCSNKTDRDSNSEYKKTKFQIGNETVTIFRRWACPTLTAVCLPNFRVQR